MHQYVQENPASRSVLPDEFTDFLLPDIPTFQQEITSMWLELDELRRRVEALENKDENHSVDVGMSELTAQMILADKSRGWKVALRKLLLLAFGQECLVNSCAVGKSNVKFEKLDVNKLRMIKGICT